MSNKIKHHCISVYYNFSSSAKKREVTKKKTIDSQPLQQISEILRYNSKTRFLRELYPSAVPSYQITNFKVSSNVAIKHLLCVLEMQGSTFQVQLSLSLCLIQSQKELKISNLLKNHLALLRGRRSMDRRECSTGSGGMIYYFHLPVVYLPLCVFSSRF